MEIDYAAGALKSQDCDQWQSMVSKSPMDMEPVID